MQNVQLSRPVSLNNHTGKGASRSLRGFELPPGDCAGIAHHDNWEDEASGAVS
jgi:hypothetical protein